MTRTFFKYVLTLLTLGLLLTQETVFACSCGGAANLKQIIDESKYIFVAEIVSATKNPDADSPWNSVVARFEVTDVIKGSPSELGSLYSGYGGGDCGMPFLVGRRMLVYTNDGTITMCGASRSLGWFGNDEEYISLLKSYVEDGVTFDFDKYPAKSGVWIRCDEQD